MTPDPIYKDIGALIKARRKTLSLKQESLAQTLSISRGSLANIETGRQSILVHQLYRFAAALQLLPSDLLPPLANDQVRAERTTLPLPDNLKPDQKRQVAELFSNGNSAEKPKLEGTNVKAAKR